MMDSRERAELDRYITREPDADMWSEDVFDRIDPDIDLEDESKWEVVDDWIVRLESREMDSATAAAIVSRAARIFLQKPPNSAT